MIDFGLACTAHIESDVHEYVTSHTKLPPNVTSLRYRSPKFFSDVISTAVLLVFGPAGLITAELLLRKSILNGRTEMVQIREIFLLMGYPNFEI